MNEKVIPIRPEPLSYEEANLIKEEHQLYMKLRENSLGILIKSRNLLERMLNPQLYEGREGNKNINKELELELTEMVKERDIRLAYNFLETVVNSMLKGLEKKYPLYNEALMIINDIHEKNRGGNK